MDKGTKEYLNARQRAGRKKTQSEPDSNGENQNALLLDATGAAGLLGFTRQYFYQLQSSGCLGPMPIHFGKRTRRSRFELIAWVKFGCPRRSEWLELVKTENMLA
jgi:hypothetical protein